LGSSIAAAGLVVGKLDWDRQSDDPGYMVYSNSTEGP